MRLLASLPVLCLTTWATAAPWSPSVDGALPPLASPGQFAVSHPVQQHLADLANCTQTAERHECVLEVQVPGATSLGWSLAGSHLGTGVLTIRDHAGRMIDRVDASRLASSDYTRLVTGSYMLLHWEEGAGQGGLVFLDQLQVGYRAPGEGFARKADNLANGNCRRNARCATQDYSGQETSAVAVVFENAYACSGVMITDVYQTGLPRVLTSRDCAPQELNEALDVTVYFNAVSDCTGDATALPAIDYATALSATGGRLLASQGELTAAPELGPGLHAIGGNALLFEITGTIPSEAAITLAGFDARDNLGLNHISLHYGAGLEQQLAEFGLPERATDAARQWQVFRFGNDDLTAGGLEDGSEGAALFDADRRVVGWLGEMANIEDSAACLYEANYNRLKQFWDGPGGEILSGDTGIAVADSMPYTGVFNPTPSLAPTPTLTAAPTPVPTAGPTVTPSVDPAPAQATPTAEPEPSAVPTPTSEPTTEVSPTPVVTPTPYPPSIDPISSFLLEENQSVQIQLAVDSGDGVEPNVFEVEVGNDTLFPAGSIAIEGNWLSVMPAANLTGSSQVWITIRNDAGETVTSFHVRVTAAPEPSATPTVAPTVAPTTTPTAAPTIAPTATPVPTQAPWPTPNPTTAPTPTPEPAPVVGLLIQEDGGATDIEGTWYMEMGGELLFDTEASSGVRCVAATEGVTATENGYAFTPVSIGIYQIVLECEVDDQPVMATVPLVVNPYLRKNFSGTVRQGQGVVLRFDATGADACYGLSNSPDDLAWALRDSTGNMMPFRRLVESAYTTMVLGAFPERREWTLACEKDGAFLEARLIFNVASSSETVRGGFSGGLGIWVLILVGWGLVRRQRG